MIAGGCPHYDRAAGCTKGVEVLLPAWARGEAFLPLDAMRSIRSAADLACLGAAVLFWTADPTFVAG